MLQNMALNVPKYMLPCWAAQQRLAEEASFLGMDYTYSHDSYPLLTRQKEEMLLQGVQREMGTNSECAAIARTKVCYSWSSGLQLRRLFSHMCCTA